MGEEDDRKENETRIIDVRTRAADCAEGGIEAQGALTPAGTTVNMTPFRNIYLGIAAGESFKFPTLVGSDLQGQSWCGSYSILSDGARVYKGQTLTRSREVVTLQLAGGVPTMSVSTKYFQVGDGGIYRIVFSTGVTYVPLSQSALPTLPKVGDTGIFGSFTGSDTTTVTVTWALKAGFNGTSVLEVSSVVSGEKESATEVDSYLLDASGVPRRVTLSATTMGSTLKLAGSKEGDE